MIYKIGLLLEALLNTLVAIIYFIPICLFVLIGVIRYSHKHDTTIDETFDLFQKEINEKKAA